MKKNPVEHHMAEATTTGKDITDEASTAKSPLYKGKHAGKHRSVLADMNSDTSKGDAKHGKNDRRKDHKKASKKKGAGKTAVVADLNGKTGKKAT